MPSFRQLAAGMASVFFVAGVAGPLAGGSRQLFFEPLEGLSAHVPAGPHVAVRIARSGDIYLLPHTKDRIQRISRRTGQVNEVPIVGVRAPGIKLANDIEPPGAKGRSRRLPGYWC